MGGISKKVQECRKRWYGHVMRRDEEYAGKRVMGIEVQGSGRRGRPKKRWADRVKGDLREKGLSGEEVYDRAAWRRLASHIDPTDVLHFQPRLEHKYGNPKVRGSIRSLDRLHISWWVNDLIPVVQTVSAYIHSLPKQRIFFYFLNKNYLVIFRYAIQRLML